MQRAARLHFYSLSEKLWECDSHLDEESYREKKKVNKLHRLADDANFNRHGTKIYFDHLLLKFICVSMK